MKNKKKNRRRTRSGFTIVEILVVVIIIGLLATMIAPPLLRHLIRTRQSVAKSNIATLEATIDSFSLVYGRLPQTLEELITRPSDIPEEKWEGASFKSKDLLDPWEREFIYKVPGDHGPYDLYSLGKDGQEGGEKEDADIVNW